MMEAAMPVVLSGKKSVKERGSKKVLKTFGSHAKALAYLRARNMGHARSKGIKGIPAPLKRKRSGRKR
jgi:hypothetical protein